jgi:hypothetical protein
MRRANSTTRRKRPVTRLATQAASGKSNRQRNQPRPEHLATQQTQCRARRVFHHAVEDHLHDHGVENQQQDKQPQQLGKYFSRQSAPLPSGVPARDRWGPLGCSGRLRGLTRSSESQSDSQLRAPSSNTADSPDRPRSSHGCGAHTRPRIAASRTARRPTPRPAGDRG